MASATTALPPPAAAYRPPALLQDIQLLDLLELSGSTQKASRLVQLSQPTISRRYRQLARDFALVANRRQAGCRYGSSRVMQLLRLGCRAHRLEAGVARLGSDLMLQPLLSACPWLLPLPAQFRALPCWLELVRQGVLDGALVSGLELQGEEQANPPELELRPVGRLPLALAVSASAPGPPSSPLPPVLVPQRMAAGGLRRALLNLGLSLRSGDPDGRNAGQWLERLAQGALALPIAPVPARALEPLLGAGRWRLAALPQPLTVPLWLVLPAGWRQQPLLTRTLEQLQRHPVLRARDQQLMEEA